MSGGPIRLPSSTLESFRADGRAVGRHVEGQHATDEASAARDVLFDLAHHRLLALSNAGWRFGPGEPTGAPLYDDLVSRALAASLARALPRLPNPAPVLLDDPLVAVPLTEPVRAREVTPPPPAPPATPARAWPSWASTPWSPPVDRNSVDPGGGA